MSFGTYVKTSAQLAPLSRQTRIARGHPYASCSSCGFPSPVPITTSISSNLTPCCSNRGCCRAGAEPKSSILKKRNDVFRAMACTRRQPWILALPSRASARGHACPGKRNGFLHELRRTRALVYGKFLYRQESAQGRTARLSPDNKDLNKQASTRPCRVRLLRGYPRRMPGDSSLTRLNSSLRRPWRIIRLCSWRGVRPTCSADCLMLPRYFSSNALR